jgi:hypothetical protein
MRAEVERLSRLVSLARSRPGVQPLHPEGA